MFKQKILRGAKLLDKTEPGWRERIDLSTLDLSDDKFCVLGQLHGSYWDSYLYMKYDTDYIETCGFTVSGNDSLEKWARLTAEWKETLHKDGRSS